MQFYARYLLLFAVHRAPQYGGLMSVSLYIYIFLIIRMFFFSCTECHLNKKILN